MNLLLVFVGGGLGAAARYLLQGAVYRFTGAAFPYGTIAVNVLGCFLIGLLIFAGIFSAFGALGGVIGASLFSKKAPGVRPPTATLPPQP